MRRSLHFGSIGEAGIPRAALDRIRAAGNRLGGGGRVLFLASSARLALDQSGRSQGAFVEDGESNPVAFRFFAIGRPVLFGVSRLLEG